MDNFIKISEFNVMPENVIETIKLNLHTTRVDFPGNHGNN